MTRKIILHTILLLFSVFLTLLWVTDAILSQYALQVSGALLFILLISRRILKLPTFKLVESVVATITILLVAGTTGGITSPLFFLNYFLLFALALLLEPIIPILLGGALITFYLLISPADESPLRWLELLSFPFITPLSFYLAKIYEKSKNQKQEIKNLSEKVEELEEELVEEEVQNHEIAKNLPAQAGIKQ